MKDVCFSTAQLLRDRPARGEGVREEKVVACLLSALCTENQATLSGKNRTFFIDKPSQTSVSNAKCSTRSHLLSAILH